MQNLDTQAAYFFNSFILTSPFWQNFWAFFNSRLADWTFDGLMIAFAIFFILQKDRKARLVKAVLLALFMIFCHNFFNRFIVQDVLVIKRKCPMDVLPNLFRLSDVIHWTKVKVRSSYCYPADHAHTCLMFVVGMFHLMGRKGGLVALLISFPFIIARLVTGNHWLTDILLGSLPLVLINLTWFFYLVNKYEQKIRNALQNT